MRDNPSERDMITNLTLSIKDNLEELTKLNTACDLLSSTVQEVEKTLQSLGIEYEVKTPDTSYRVLAFKKVIIGPYAFKKVIIGPHSVRRLHVRSAEKDGRDTWRCWTDLSREEKIYSARYLPELLKHILQEARRLTRLALETQQSILKETSNQKEGG
jgi:hypothetical protein